MRKNITKLAKGVIGLQVDSAAICKSMATTLTIVEKDAMGFYKEASMSKMFVGEK